MSPALVRVRAAHFALSASPRGLFEGLPIQTLIVAGPRHTTIRLWTGAGKEAKYFFSPSTSACSGRSAVSPQRGNVLGNVNPIG